MSRIHFLIIFTTMVNIKIVYKTEKIKKDAMIVITIITNPLWPSWFQHITRVACWCLLIHIWDKSTLAADIFHFIVNKTDSLDYGSSFRALTNKTELKDSSGEFTILTFRKILIKQRKPKSKNMPESQKDSVLTVCFVLFFKSPLSRLCLCALLAIT